MNKSNRRIAVVDDDAPVMKALMRLLETSYCDVRGFQSARELLSGLSDGLPECMIVDLQMPNMTGLELQHHLAHIGIKIPTIVITAHDEPGDRERCIAAGAAAYLLKPVRKATLLATVSMALAAPTSSLPTSPQG
jgi:FixJ family two-component response regulator